MTYKKLLEKFHRIFKGVKKLSPLILFNLLPLAGYIIYSELTNPAPTFQSAPENSNYLYEAENEVFKVSVGDKKTGSAKVNFENSKGENISFNFLAKEDVSVSLNNSGRRSLVFSNVDRGIDLEYETLGNGLKEWIVIDESVDRNFFVFETDAEGLKGINNYRDVPAPGFVNEKGDYAFNIQKGYAIDAAGKRTENVYTRFIEKEERSYLKVDVDPKWLESKDRRFPIRIDPTIVYDESSEFSNGSFNRNTDKGSGSDPRIETSNFEQVSDGSVVALWHMDEASGTRDDAVGGNNLTDNNTVTSAVGKVGNAAQFESSNSEYLSLSDNPDISVGNIDFSISAWVKPDSIGGNNMIITKYTNTSVRDYQLYINVTPYFEFSIFNSSGTQVGTVEATTFGTVKSGQWYFVYAFHEASSSRIGISVDGVFDYVTASGDPADTAANLQVGARGGTLFWDGLIDELAFRKKLLTQEELNSAQSNRPYSVYTSDVIDLGNNVNEWGDFIWDEYGVATSNGETVFDDTSLVAQWDFNNTSGTTATNDAGSCGASCNGTLTNFASTSSQDQAAGTGWTANYRRWGAGALNFDGANDEVRVADNSFDAFGTTGTIEGWININHDTSDQHTIFSYSDSASSNYYLSFFVNTDLTLYARVRLANGSTQWTCATTTKIVSNKWQHVAWTHSPSAVKIYINGTEEAINCTEEGGAIAVNTYFDDIASNAELATIGARRNTTQEDQLNGVMDSVRLYSRALSTDEILANFNSANVQFQTRVGDNSSPYDGDWEDWEPAISETPILSFDSSLTDELVSYWKLDEASGMRKDSWGLNNLADNNTVTNQTGIINAAADFESDNSEYLSISDNSSLSMGDENFSISAWVKLESVTGNRKVVVAKGDTNTSLAQEYLLWYNPANNRFTFHLSDGTVQTVITADNFGAASTGVWYHLLAIHDADTDTISIRVNNGTPNTNSHSGGVQDSTNPFHIGRGYAGGSNHYFDGLIDEVGIWRKALTDDEITSLYSSGKPLHYPDGTDFRNNPLNGGIKISLDEEIKREGDGSQKLELGKLQVDGATVALWSMDETNGDNAGVDIFDSTANNLDGEFEGSNIATSVINGISGKARGFNGSNDYISIANNSALNLHTFTYEAWVKIDDFSTAGIIFDGGGQNNTPRFGYNVTTGTLRVLNSNVETLCTSASAPPLNQWSHVAVTYSASSGDCRIYINGALNVSATNTTTFTYGSSTRYIGTEYIFAEDFDGAMDELRVSSVIRTAEEIAESYQMARDHYLNKTISSLDLSNKDSLSFWIAADRPGTYIDMMIGESAYSNWQPENNTIGLWKFDESTDDACNNGASDSCDSSGNGFHLTAISAPPSIQGVVGRGRDLDGSADYLYTADTTGSALDITGSITLEGWVRVDNKSSGEGAIISKGTWDNWPYYLAVNQTNSTVRFRTNKGSGNEDLNTTETITRGKWTYIVATYDGSTKKIYIDGELSASASYSGSLITNNGNLCIGSVSDSPCATGTHILDGQVDQVRLSNVARTASQVREAYETGLRTYSTTIDFAAALDSSDMISNSSDLSFTVDATPFGLSQKGSMLFLEDKIIIREKVNDTEYIAQGNVSSVNPSTGEVTVAQWDSGSTFPSGGYSANASVFKWQREFWPIRNNTLAEYMDSITQLTMRITNGSEGRTVWIDDLKSTEEYLTDPSGSEIVSSLGNRYFQYRAVLTSTDPKASAGFSSVEFDYTAQTAPDTPTLDSPADRTKTSLTPQLKTTTNDNELDNLQYKIILCENSSMDYKCQTFDQTSSQTGWSGQDAESSTMYSSGTQATYTIQTPLEAGKVYYWKSYAIDPNGLNDWSSTQTNARVIYMNSHPRSPSASNYEHYIARRENPLNATSSGWSAITGAAQSGTTASDNGWIDSSNLTAGDRYLVMVWGEHNSDSTNATSGIRVKHGSASFTESETIEKTGNTNTSHKTPYNWFTVWEAQSGEDLEVELYWGGEDGSQARVEDVTLVAINAEQLIANGDLKYDIDTTGGALTGTFSSNASLTWTPQNDNDPWWIVAYVQPQIQNDSGKIESRFNINSTPHSAQKLSENGQFINDLPIYSLGTALTLSEESNSISLQSREIELSGGTPTSISESPSAYGGDSIIDPENVYVSDNNRATIPYQTTNCTVDTSLSWNGGTNYTSAETKLLPEGSDDIRTYGGSTETWGRSWSSSDLTDGNFVVRISDGADPTYSGFGFNIPSGSTIEGIEVNIEGNCASPVPPLNPGEDYIDHIEATVYYTPPAPSSTSEAAAIMALRLNTFNDFFFSSKTGNNPNMSTAAEWVEQMNADPLVQLQNNWLISAGALVNDNGARVVSRIQDSDINITDDTGGWLKGAGNLLSTNLGDLRPSWSAGLKNVDFDSQTTVSGTANLTAPWLVGFSLEKYTANNGPRPDSPNNGATNQSIRPQIKMTAIDADNDNMKYKIQLCTNAGMTSGCQTFDQTATQSGWSGQNANSNTRYQSGTQATYTLQTDLATNTTYYWRAYAIDETGLNVFSAPGSIFSFTTTQVPTSPTVLQTEGSTNPNDVTDSTPEFSAIHNDPNSDNANFQRIQVNTQSDFAGTMMWNPGKTSMTSTANGARSPEISYAGNALSTGVTYYWRIKFWDVNGAEGEWSEPAHFSLLGLVPVNGCYMEETDDDSAIIIHWNNTSTIEDGYRVQRSVNGGAFSNLIDKAANSTSHTDSSISIGNTYRYRIAAKLGVMVGTYCTTTTADVSEGSIQFEGLQLDGIQIN